MSRYWVPLTKKEESRRFTVPTASDRKHTNLHGCAAQHRQYLQTVLVLVLVLVAQSSTTTTSTICTTDKSTTEQYQVLYNRRCVHSVHEEQEATILSNLFPSLPL